MSNIVSISHQKLEIKHILDKLSTITVLPEVKRMIDSMMPSNDIDVLNKDLKVMDSTATALCKDNNIPILVFGIAEPENMVRAVKGEHVGTLVE